MAIPPEIFSQELNRVMQIAHKSAENDHIEYVYLLLGITHISNWNELIVVQATASKKKGDQKTPEPTDIEATRKTLESEIGRIDTDNLIEHVTRMT